MLSISHDGKMNIYIQQFNRPNKENILRSITVSAQNCWLAIIFDFSKIFLIFLRKMLHWYMMVLGQYRG